MTVIRWLLGAGLTYEEAGRRYAPFNRLAAPDPASREAVAALARAAVAAGADGVFLEVHPDPEHALSDSAVQLPLERAAELLKSLLAIRKAL